MANSLPRVLQVESVVVTQVLMLTLTLHLGENSTRVLDNLAGVLFSLCPFGVLYKPHNYTRTLAAGFVLS